ncbi:50S ribosomal protein L6 [Patescibacteria group bacterium]|nr:50S ribosomal protein L6 [Patescibacteria group bacterium]
MSKIGKIPITISDGVTITTENNLVNIKGPKGELAYSIPSDLKITLEDGLLKVDRKKNSTQARALHGTWRSHLQNAIIGVKEGYKKELELVGLGYRSEIKGEKLVLQVGFSHPVEIDVPEEINMTADKNQISVEGIDKQKVGQIAAIIRRVRPPEPYKGTGIRYKNEIIRRKAGKSAKAVGSGTNT